MSTLSAPELDDFADLDIEPVEIRRNSTLAAGIGGVATIVALAYLTRALGGGAALDWLLALAMGLVAAAYLSAFLDARTPLLVADEQGIRLRLGRTWRGVPWDSLDCVEVQPRRGLLRDGRVVIVVDDPDALLADLDRSGCRQAAIATRLHGSPLAVPLSLSTWVAGGDADLADALAALAGDAERVVEIVDEQDAAEWDEDVEDEWYGHSEDLDHTEPAEHAGHHPVLPDPRPALARGIDYLADRLRRRDVPADEPEAAVASEPPVPLRDPIVGARVEAVYEAPPTTAEPTRPIALDEVEPELIEPELIEPEVEPVLIEDVDVEAYEPVADPVVGPQIVAARTRLRLSVDQLAERTRIRPHVIESIEVDDFAPCGGDFYARGHLRTLARVLGIDAAPLLAAYDETYADAPLDARRVFEAELATGAEGPIRSTRGGPNWSVLIAAVMALVLAWSIARLIMDSPVELTAKPELNGSPSGQGKLASPVPVLLNAAAGGAHVVVRDGAGEVVFNGDLAFGEQKSLEAAPPVHVQSSDGALQVSVDGEDRGPLGAEGQPAQNTYAAAP